MKRFILLSLLFCAALAACQDNEQADVADAYAGNASKRVKRITERIIYGEITGWTLAIIVTAP